MPPYHTIHHRMPPSLGLFQLCTPVDLLHAQLDEVARREKLEAQQQRRQPVGGVPQELPILIKFSTDVAKYVPGETMRLKLKKRTPAKVPSRALVLSRNRLRTLRPKSYRISHHRRPSPLRTDSRVWRSSHPRPLALTCTSILGPRTSRRGHHPRSRPYLGCAGGRADRRTSA